MSDVTPRNVKRLSMDDIEMAINEVAQDPDGGPDRFRALKLLTTMQGSSVALPPPLGEDQIVERLALLLRAAGPEVARIAFRRAQGNRGSVQITDPVEIVAGTLTVDQRDECRRIKSLRKYYQRFPSVRRPGFPKGYPYGKGNTVQVEWIYRESIKNMIAEVQAKADAALAADQPAPEAASNTDVPGPDNAPLQA